MSPSLRADINECEDFRLCANGRCINTEGSFQCQCYSGFQRTQEGSHCEGTNRSAEMQLPETQMAAIRFLGTSPTFWFSVLQTSTSARGRPTASEAAASTVWARTTASARRATCWSEGGDAKVSPHNYSD